LGYRSIAQTLIAHICSFQKSECAIAHFVTLWKRAIALCVALSKRAIVRLSTKSLFSKERQKERLLIFKISECPTLSKIIMLVKTVNTGVKNVVSRESSQNLDFEPFLNVQ